MFLRSVFIFMLVTCSQGAHAQTTQPADESGWPTVVDQAAAALTAGDLPAFRALMTDPSAIRQFASKSSEDVGATLIRCRNGVLLGAHPYVNPPFSMAADLAADCKTTTDLPDVFRRRMIPLDDGEMQRANATAAQWVGTSLNAGTGAFVAVILVWCPENPTSARGETSEDALDSSSPHAPLELASHSSVDAPKSTASNTAGDPTNPPAGRIIFALLKGQLTATNQMRISLAIIGSPLSTQ